MQKSIIVLAVALCVVAFTMADKPGACPSVFPTFVGKCQQECTTDDGCPAEQKCCHTGCWSVCRSPDTTDGEPCNVSCIMGNSCKVSNGKPTCVQSQ